MGLIHTGFPRTLAAATLNVLGLLLFCSCVAFPSEAAEPSSRKLDAGWQFRAVANTDRSDVKEWHPAQVPGVVQTDLLHSALIPDPFDRDNEFRLQWIGLADWEYQTTFQLDAAALAHDHVDLVFDGLDTFADVYLNDQAILHADNMFRHWRVPAKAMLKPGPNTLRIVFHSVVEKMLPYVKSLPYALPSISTFVITCGAPSAPTEGLRSSVKSHTSSLRLNDAPGFGTTFVPPKANGSSGACAVGRI